MSWPWLETPEEREAAKRCFEQATLAMQRRLGFPRCRHGKLAEPCADCQGMMGDPHCVRWNGRRTCDRPRSAHPLADCSAFQRPGDPP